MSSDVAEQAARAAQLALDRTREPVSLIIAASDETSALATGPGKITIRAPFTMTLTQIPRAHVSTAPTGATIIVDINVAGATIMDTTKLSIDAGEETSKTAAVPVVLSTTHIADDAEIRVDIDQVGSSTKGAGLKVTLYGVRA